MSGPLAAADAPTNAVAGAPSVCDVELIAGRDAQVGGVGVRRLLPRRARRMVGAWCFADHIGPAQVTRQRALDIGPHPHIGLQTVTWLLRGQILHRDSLRSEQLVRPGQLNLMTAGHGVSHSEETAGFYEGQLRGVQFWVAQPSTTRDAEPSFEHHAALPHVDLRNGRGTLLVGEFLAASSPARCDTDHVGVELDLTTGRCELPLDPEFEYAVIVLDGTVVVAGCPLDSSNLGYLGVGRDELQVDALGPGHVLLIGGRPFPEPVLMWWNYVGRTREEITEAHDAWLAGDRRFGRVASPLEPMHSPAPPWR